MKSSLRPGVSRVNRVVVDQARTISFMGAEARTYATPSMILDIEQTCRELILEHADAGEDSVGMEVDVKHLAPTLLGMTAEITVKVVAVEGRKVAVRGRRQGRTRPGRQRHAHALCRRQGQDLRAPQGEGREIRGNGEVSARSGRAGAAARMTRPRTDSEGFMFERAAETMPRADLAALQLATAARHGRARLRQGSGTCGRNSTPRGVTPDHLKTLADIARFPFATKADLRDNYPFGLFAVPREEIVRIHASSGTTGKPTVVGYTRGRSRPVVEPDGALARLHGRPARATSSTTPSATACSPAGSAFTTAPSGWA